MPLLSLHREKCYSSNCFFHIFFFLMLVYTKFVMYIPIKHSIHFFL